MKVLFLDIDGPLNLWPNPPKGINAKFSKEACSNLEFLLNKLPDVHIVVSSAWRKQGLDFVKSVLQNNGIDPRRVYDITGNEILGTMDHRGHQIQCWLDRNPEVKVFAVCDDEAYDLKTFHDEGKLVKPNRYVGLTQSQADALISILQK